MSTLRALAFGNVKKKKKKNYFAYSNTTLSILPTHFTTYLISQFYFYIQPNKII